jgi:hypothetical protein
MALRVAALWAFCCAAVKGLPSLVDGMSCLLRTTPAPTAEPLPDYVRRALGA